MKLAKYFSIFSQIFADEKRPNVILLLADDFGVGDFQVNQAKAKVPTPNIDRLGTEGVNFKDAHSGSSRCSPSRYMLLTGRYSLKDSKERIIKPGREPHLGLMFKKAGYTTGVFGKTQPFQTMLRNDIQSEDHIRWKKLNEWKKTYANGEKFNDRFDEKRLFFRPGNYTFMLSEIDHGFDYSFSAESPCCSPNGYFENGKQVEPFTEWAIQRYFPEEGPTQRELDTGIKFWKGAYVAAPWPKEETYGERFTNNYPRSMIAQPNFDSRTKDLTISTKLNEFIKANADSDKPFFAYYGMRFGHGPFNSQEKFRNTTEVGIVGEMIAEADEMVGKLFKALEESNQINNTLIVLMSDNGAGTNYEPVNEALYGHTQNAIDLTNGEHGLQNVRLKGGKGTNWEGGHRMPFMWWYPKGFPARTIEDKIVSYVDVYRTLSDLVEYKPKCNEGPDSRSLFPLLTGASDKIDGPEEIMTHAVHYAPQAIRWRKWKLMPKSKEFYKIECDPAEEHNLWDKEWAQQMIQRWGAKLESNIARIDEREEKTNYGQLEICI